MIVDKIKINNFSFSGLILSDFSPISHDHIYSIFLSETFC